MFIHGPPRARIARVGLRCHGGGVARQFDYLGGGQPGAQRGQFAARGLVGRLGQESVYVLECLRWVGRGWVHRATV